MAMGEIYEKDKPSIDEYVRNFNLINSLVGAVFMIIGKVAGFWKNNMLKAGVPKLLIVYPMTLRQPFLK
jgi:hypothetical protein